MKYLYPNATIQIFCKAPIAGKAKTRLMPELTADQAAKVHQQLTYQTLKWLTASQLCPIQLWCTPCLDYHFFIEMATTFSLSLHLQSSGDLGERMYHALHLAGKENQQTLLMGCDCVSLSKKELTHAIEALITDVDIVLAPAEDGGYCLVGVNDAEKKVFDDISWGTDQVMRQTRKQINQLKLKCLELNTQWDVDFYVDYLRFIKITRLPHV